MAYMCHIKSNIHVKQNIILWMLTDSNKYLAACGPWNPGTSALI